MLHMPYCDYSVVSEQMPNNVNTIFKLWHIGQIVHSIMLYYNMYYVEDVQIFMDHHLYLEIYYCHKHVLF